MSADIKALVEQLGLQRHPAGGWYATHYSDSEIWGRAKFSSIYYLLAGDEPMPLHKVDGIEVWHFYKGAPAEFVVTNGAGHSMTSTLGSDLLNGQYLQVAVPAYFWQSCRSLGEWTLLGCCMSPGFSPRTTVVLDSEA